MMPDARDIQHSQNLEAMDRLERRIEALTAGIGASVQRHGEEIAVLKNDVSNLNKAGWILVTSSMIVIVAAFWKIVLK